MTDTGKSLWPELTGLDVDRAKAVIEGERPDLTVRPVPTDHDVPTYYDEGRVWLWHDPATRIVVDEPMIG